MTFNELTNLMETKDVGVHLYTKFIVPAFRRSGEVVWHDALLERIDFENNELSHVLTHEEKIVFKFNTEHFVKIFVSQKPPKFNINDETNVSHDNVVLFIVEAVNDVGKEIVDKLSV